MTPIINIKDNYDAPLVACQQSIYGHSGFINTISALWTS